MSRDTSAEKSSFEAFSKVDAIVSKPVLGSDGAASWQNFQKTQGPSRPSVAPKAPLKKADKLATGFTSWEQERGHEDKVRKEAGHVETGSGYTNFKKKNSAEEAAERKRIKQIEARIRPDKQDYFIASETFTGWKFDYIFTTRPDRGTGYFWDGTDSIKKLRGELEEEPVKVPEGDEQPETADVKPPKKKRKKKSGPVIVSDPNNPREQIAEVIRKRNQQIATDSTIPPGWETAKDPTSGKTYYFCRATGERSWDKPQEPAVTQSQPAESDSLPPGWKAATDSASGKQYYYHEDGQTRWEKPKA